MAELTASLILILFFTISAAMPIGGAAAGKPWYKNIRRGNEKLAKLHVYVQDIISSGPNQTVYEVARASISSNTTTSFGLVYVVDDLVTAEPDINSEKVGRVQGIVTSADMATTAMIVNINFVFTSGKYNGSTISIVGRNPVMEQERELPVVGGTGVFRFARGYVITRTYSSDFEAGYVVYEYTIYVTYVDA